MQNLGYSFPKSFVKCAKSLCEQFSYGDKWIFLSGDSGSGRTSICEHVVNTLEGKFNTIFIPCKDDLSLVALRKLWRASLSCMWILISVSLLLSHGRSESTVVLDIEELEH